MRRTTLRNISRRRTIALLATVSALPLAGVACGETYYLDEDDFYRGDSSLPADDPAPAVSPADPGPEFVDAVSTKAKPISGGTLAVEGNLAVAADPERDRVSIVDLNMASVANLDLPQGSEPGRVAIEGASRAHVVLRSAGAIASIDLVAKKVLRTTPVCRVPRGIAIDTGKSEVVVVCAEGLLVRLDAATGEIVSKNAIRDDARDVVVVPSTGEVIYDRFRTAEVESDRRGTLQPEGAATRVAWRMVAVPGSDTPAVIEQEVRDPASEGSSVAQVYYGALNSPASTSIVAPRVQRPNDRALTFPTATLAVDIAATERVIAIAAAGNSHTPRLPQVLMALLPSKPLLPSTGLGAVSANALAPKDLAPLEVLVKGQVTSVAMWKDDTVVVQSREPATLSFIRYGISSQSVVQLPSAEGRSPLTIDLGGESVEDRGQAIFHANTGGRIACASCHAEGGDDGRTWLFPNDGKRRTSSLLGTFAGTAPYHWMGEERDLDAIVRNVFQKRMQGPTLDASSRAALKTWLERLPAPIAYEAPSEASRKGEIIFGARCASCHAGPAFTNNATVDVGTSNGLSTSEPFQVPSLVGLSTRAPYMHDGCAKTLGDRFSPMCGGKNHGNAAALTPMDREDLISYLKTL